MWKFKYHCILIALGLPILFSCNDENNNLGKGLVDSKFRNILCDSCTISVSAVLIDSLETSGKGVALVGKYQHPLWGTVTSGSYIPYKRPSYTMDASRTVVFDSIVLQLSHTGYFIGDTIPEQRFGIHELEEKIILKDNGYLYSHDSVMYKPHPLAIYTYKPKPNMKDYKKLEVRLPDHLGRELLTRFHNYDDAVSENRFEDYFKGIAIVPDPDISQSVIGFAVKDTLASIDIYYHTTEDAETQQTLRFLPYAEHQFNHFDYDRRGTSMEGNSNDIPSTGLNGKGVLMGGVGWYSRLEFPYLNEIQKQGRIINVQEAYLKIYPEYQTYSPLNALPDSMFLFVADENHVVTEVVKDYLGNQVQSGKLVKDDSFEGNTHYYFDITKFMQKELEATGKFKHNLQLMFNESDYTNTFKNLTFRDQQGKSPITLLLTYKIYESY